MPYSAQRTSVIAWIPRRVAALRGLPSYLDCSESIGEHGEFGDHGGEPFDQWDQPVFRHGWNEIVKHAALTEQ
jgi:hypothetical protein